MNKRDLIDAVSGRMGDKRTAAEAVNAVLDTIQETVASGDKVSITGFGVFEKQVRAARTARNPATGATVKVPKTSVPKFRAGADFKAMVNTPSRGRARTAAAASTGPKRGATTTRTSRAGTSRAGTSRAGTSRAGTSRSTGARTTRGRAGR
jgi:DNA-binding protein HU-beta